MQGLVYLGLQQVVSVNLHSLWKEQPSYEGIQVAESCVTGETACAVAPSHRCKT